jgi:hypothetical protein
MNPIARRQNKYSQDEVSLQLIQVDVERVIQAEASGDERDDLCNQPVQICEARLCDVETILADIVDSFVVNLRNNHQCHNHKNQKANKDTRYE